MKCYFLIFLIIVLLSSVFGSSCFSQKNITVTIKNNHKWYFLIFSKKTAFNPDSVFLIKSNYEVIKEDKSLSKFKVINNKHVDIRKDIMLLEFTELKGYKILMFYYPSKKEAYLNFKKNDNKVTLIELKGNNELNKIISHLNE